MFTWAIASVLFATTAGADCAAAVAWPARPDDCRVRLTSSAKDHRHASPNCLNPLAAPCSPSQLPSRPQALHARRHSKKTWPASARRPTVTMLFTPGSRLRPLSRCFQVRKRPCIRKTCSQQASKVGCSRNLLSTPPGRCSLPRHTAAGEIQNFRLHVTPADGRIENHVSAFRTSWYAPFASLIR